MRRLGRCVAAGFLAGALPVSLCAHEVAFKDGRVIAFKACRVAEKKLFCANGQGQETGILLADVDFDRTRQLNANESPALELPDTENYKSAPPGPAEQSLGQVARRLRKKGTDTTSKWVFTDDDVAHSSEAGNLAASVETSSGWRKFENDAGAIADALAGLAQKELAERALGEYASVRFVGREEWESRLFAAKEDFLRVFRTSIDTYRHSHELLQALVNAKSLSKGDEMKYQQAKLAEARASAAIQDAYYKYKAIVSEGANGAKEWKSR